MAKSISQSIRTRAAKGSLAAQTALKEAALSGDTSAQKDVLAIAKAQTKARVKTVRAPKSGDANVMQRSVQDALSAKGKASGGANVAQFVTKGLGMAIAKQLEQQAVTTFNMLKDLWKYNAESLAQCENELKEAKAQKIADIGADAGSKDSGIKQRRRNSVQSTFSRILKIVHTMWEHKQKGSSAERILNAGGIHEAYAACSKSGSSGRVVKPLVGSGFTAWLEKLDRVCMDAKDTDQIMHLEEVVRQAVAKLAKFSTHSSLPAKEMQALTTASERHLKAITKGIRKAA